MSVPQSATAPAAGLDSAATLEALLDSRYSCRSYLPTPVPRATIDRILQAAQRTASWCNSQPWQTVIVTGAATERFRQALVEHVTQNASQPDITFPREYTGSYRDRRKECGLQLYQAVGIGRDDKAAAKRQALENHRLFGAPHVALITTPEALGPYGAVDCGAYVSNFMLAARSLGVASIAQAALASHSGFVRDFLGLPDDRQLVCGISFGFEDVSHPANKFRTARASIAEAVTWLEE